MPLSNYMALPYIYTSYIKSWLMGYWFWSYWEVTITGSFVSFSFNTSFSVDHYDDVIMRSNTSGHISRMVDPIDVKEKQVHQLDHGWIMWPWPLTPTMTLTLDFSRPNFEIAVSSDAGVPSTYQVRMFFQINTKRKQVNDALNEPYSRWLLHCCDLQGYEDWSLPHFPGRRSHSLARQVC